MYASPQRDICRVRGSPIDPAAELSSPQRILGRFSALDRLGISVAVLRVRTVRGRIADATAVSSIGDRSFLVAAADRQERALRVGSAPRDDIDDAVHGIGAPQARPGPRMISMRSMSSIRRSWASQKMPENSGE